MNGDYDVTARQAIANGFARERALSVLMPRVLGGVETHGRVLLMECDRCLMATNFVVADENEFGILLQGIRGPEHPATFWFAVTWKDIKVLQGSIHPDRRGAVLGGLVRIEHWARGRALGAWQPTLFDVFPIDSRLLDSDDVEQSLRCLYEYRRSLMREAEFDLGEGCE